MTEELNKPPYESAYVSAFIYALGRLDGVESGSNQDVLSPLGMAILLTQNPLEAAYGDLAGGWKGRLFLLEFKRDQAHVYTERTKDRRKPLLEALNNPGMSLHRDQANRGHFVVYPDSDSAELVDLLFQPYPSIAVEPFEPALTMGFNDFLNRLRWITRRGASMGLNAKEFEAYLTFAHQFETNAGTASPDEIAGLLVGVDEKGLVVLMQYGGLAYLLTRYTEAVAARSQKSGTRKRGRIGGT